MKLTKRLLYLAPLIGAVGLAGATPAQAASPNANRNRFLQLISLSDQNASLSLGSSSSGISARTSKTGIRASASGATGQSALLERAFSKKLDKLRSDELAFTKFIDKEILRLGTIANTPRINQLLNDLKAILYVLTKEERRDLAFFANQQKSGQLSRFAYTSQTSYSLATYATTVAKYEYGFLVASTASR